MTGFQEFRLADVRQAGDRPGYRELLRRPGMSMGLYVLPVGGTDTQHPHAADEVYVVLGGQGSLRVEGEVHEVREGSVVSVDRGFDHGFVDIREDLHTSSSSCPTRVTRDLTARPLKEVTA